MYGAGRSVSCAVEFSDTPLHIKEQVTKSGEAGYHMIVVPARSSALKIFQTQELLMESLDWRRFVVVRLSHSVHSQVDSSEGSVRREAEERLMEELRAVSHLDLQALIISLNSEDNMNLARIMKGQMVLGCQYSVWVEVTGESWDWWNRFRLVTDSKLVKVCLRLTSQSLTDLQLERWLGEPLAAISVPSSLFRDNKKGYPVLDTNQGVLLRQLSTLNTTIIVTQLEGGRDVKHYRDYLHHLYSKFPASLPADALLDSLKLVDQEVSDIKSYEAQEADVKKYKWFEKALLAAMKDQLPEEEADSRELVVMVLGAGRGHLVKVVLAMSERSNRRVKVIAVESELGASISLANLHLELSWGDTVRIIPSLGLITPASDQVDIIVTELSEFELSAERLDQAKKLLKDGGVCIPSSQITYIAPLQSSKLHHQLQDSDEDNPRKDPVSVYESLYKVKPRELFRFDHPNLSNSKNDRYSKVSFHLKADSLLHGFAVFIKYQLYQEEEMSNLPASETMTSMSPLYLPVMKPIQVHEKDDLEVHVWRNVSDRNVWYEWALGGPVSGPLHNPRGRSSQFSLSVDL